MFFKRNKKAPIIFSKWKLSYFDNIGIDTLSILYRSPSLVIQLYIDYLISFGVSKILISYIESYLEKTNPMNKGNSNSKNQYSKEVQENIVEIIDYFVKNYNKP